MPRTLTALQILPPMAIARLGGSSTPLESFSWSEDEGGHGQSKTVIVPDISLSVEHDGTVRAYLPSHIRFRDHDELRPVAPFLELWAQLEDAEGRIEEKLKPVTLELLEELGCSLDSVFFRLSAANRKAARRTGDDACAFMACVETRASDWSRHPLLAFSPLVRGKQPLVSREQPIPLGHFQVIKPQRGAEHEVNLSTVRVRFTPAKGYVYGPPSAGEAESPRGVWREVVPEANRILNEESSWTSYDADYARFRNPEPFNTYDGEQSADRVSLGVVDDTCDAILDATLVIGGARFTAHARIFVGPPHYAPDRRPFVSVTDDLADRELGRTPIDEVPLYEVHDLFQRVFETLALTNLDSLRSYSLDRENRDRSDPSHSPRTDEGSMTEADAPYAEKVPLYGLPRPPVREEPHRRLPYSEIARAVHEPLADIEQLKAFVEMFGPRVAQILRPPWAAFEDLASNVDGSTTVQRDPRRPRDTLHDMRMPPFMRDSDARPLSLTRRQYYQVLEVVERLSASRGAEPKSSARQIPLTPFEIRRAQFAARKREQE
jgi:hypothetical protein